MILSAAMTVHSAIRLRILCLGCFLLICQRTFGQVRLPRVVSDGMVLQREAPINIWGWAKAGGTVDVTLNGQTSRAITGSDGKWKVRLAAQKDGGPYQMQLKGSNQLTLSDIMIGDVWLCAGQLNMVIPMERVKVCQPRPLPPTNKSYRQPLPILFLAYEKDCLFSGAVRLNWR